MVMWYWNSFRGAIGWADTGISLHNDFPSWFVDERVDIWKYKWKYNVLIDEGLSYGRIMFDDTLKVLFT